MKRLLFLLCLALAQVVSAQNEDNFIADAPEQMAQFPGDIYQWLSQNIRYPRQCQQAGVEGRVMMTFIIEKDGSITFHKFVRSDNEAFSAEARRLLTKMPQWKPAQNEGKVVRQRLTMPLKFELGQGPLTDEQKAVAQRVRKIYDTVSQYDDTNLFNLFTTKAFRTKMQRIERWDEKQGEIGFLDYDVWQDAQDNWDIFSVGRPRKRDNGTYAVSVLCQMQGEEEGVIVELLLKQEDKQWLVEDFTTHNSLQAQMDKYIQENRIK